MIGISFGLSLNAQSQGSLETKLIGHGGERKRKCINTQVSERRTAV
jgi:hypothetical protein